MRRRANQNFRNSVQAELGESAGKGPAREIGKIESLAEGPNRSRPKEKEPEINWKDPVYNAWWNRYKNKRDVAERLARIMKSAIARGVRTDAGSADLDRLEAEITDYMIIDIAEEFRASGMANIVRMINDGARMNFAEGGKTMVALRMILEGKGDREIKKELGRPWRGSSIGIGSETGPELGFEWKPDRSFGSRCRKGRKH